MDKAKAPQPATPTTSTWSDRLDLGIRSIDRQHQDLLASIGELETLHHDGRDAEALDVLLPQLQTYALFHFSEEDGMMRMLVGQDEAVCQHRIQHQAFVRQVQYFVESREFHGDRAVATRLVQYLRAWLVHHIDTADRDIAGKLLAQCHAFAAH